MEQLVHSESHMQPQGRNPHWPAILIERRVGDPLQIECREESWKQSHVVVALENILRAVLQFSVSNQEVQSAARQIYRVYTGEPAGRERGRRRVIGPPPPRARNRYSTLSQTINRRECEALCLPIVPAQP